MGERITKLLIYQLTYVMVDRYIYKQPTTLRCHHQLRGSEIPEPDSEHWENMTKTSINGVSCY